MREKHENLVPDYYARFACKMGRCRTACCDGWPVALTMPDYFRLLGVGCSAELRRGLDVALRVEDYPSEEKYAEINHRYDGTCPLRLADGRCGVQAELGEDMLPTVCRLYPRGVRSEDGRERSCACSCEAVVELLLHHPEPIELVRAEYPDDPALAAAQPSDPAAARERLSLRIELIGIVQNRTMLLRERLPKVGRRLGVSAAYEMTGASPTAESAEDGLRAVERLTGLIDERSDSLRAYGDEALGLFRGESAAEDYLRAVRRFESAFPGWESFIENLLVNHMFFSRFPFGDGEETAEDEFLGLCAIYALLRFLFAGHLSLHDGEDALADVAAAAFRLIDHTLFHRSAAHILREAGYAEPGRLDAMLGV